MTLCACAETRDDDELTRTVAEFISAVESQEWDRAWALTSSDAQAEVVALHGLLHGALQAVPLVYPEDLREQAAAAVGRDVVGDISPQAPDVGPRFMSRVLEPTALRFDQQARDGLLSATTTIEGDRASLVTAAGETFTFVRVTEGDAGSETWRSRTVMDILAASEAMSRLREQAEALLAVKEEHEKAWRGSLDPRQPQGAYNRLRQACTASPPDVGTIHSLLDDVARSTLEEALTQARKVQRIVQRRSRLEDRKEAYRRRGISMFVKARTDLQLYAAWAGSETWKRPVPVHAEPTAVERTAETAGKAVVVTSNGERVQMQQHESGMWQLTTHDKELRDALLSPIEERLKALRAPK